MFNQARLRLTLWYVVIIFLITSLFSVAFYQVSTKEIQRILDHMQTQQERWGDRLEIGPQPPPDMPSLEELQASKQRLLINLLMIDGIILIITGGAAFILAGKTLQPIKLMIDEQNQFISNSSHELRTPLASLKAEMEGNLLEKKVSDKQARRLINSNLEDVNRLQKLTDNLLNLVKLHDLSPIEYSEHISLKKVLQRAIKQVKPLADKKNIYIQQQLTDVQIKGEFDDLCELMVILLDNAIKYSDQDKPIEVTIEDDQEKAKITITDHGIGIDESEINQIFDRFFRSDKSRSTTAGFGLGLSIASQIIRQHGGHIKVTSKLGKGSVFTIEFPSVH